MNRRQGIIAALAAAVGFMAKAANAGEPLTGSSWVTDNMTSITIQPMDVTFDLDTFKDFTFKQGKDTITLTPAEIMAALKSEH